MVPSLPALGAQPPSFLARQHRGTVRPLALHHHRDLPEGLEGLAVANVLLVGGAAWLWHRECTCPNRSNCARVGRGVQGVCRGHAGNASIPSSPVGRSTCTCCNLMPAPPSVLPQERAALGTAVQRATAHLQRVQLCVVVPCHICTAEARCCWPHRLHGCRAVHSRGLLCVCLAVAYRPAAAESKRPDHNPPVQMGPSMTSRRLRRQWSW